MRCDDAQLGVSLRADGEPPGVPLDEPRRPPASCGSCRAFAAVVHDLRADLRVEAVDHVPDLGPSVLALVAAEPSRTPSGAAGGAAAAPLPPGGSHDASQRLPEWRTGRDDLAGRRSRRSRPAGVARARPPWARRRSGGRRGGGPRRRGDVRRARPRARPPCGSRRARPRRGGADRGRQPRGPLHHRRAGRPATDGAPRTYDARTSCTERPRPSPCRWWRPPRVPPRPSGRGRADRRRGPLVARGLPAVLPRRRARALPARAAARWSQEVAGREPFSDGRPGATRPGRARRQLHAGGGPRRAGRRTIAGHRAVGVSVTAAQARPAPRRAVRRRRAASRAPGRPRRAVARRRAPRAARRGGASGGRPGAGRVGRVAGASPTIRARWCCRSRPPRRGSTSPGCRCRRLPAGPPSATVDAGFRVRHRPARTPRSRSRCPSPFPPGSGPTAPVSSRPGAAPAPGCGRGPTGAAWFTVQATADWAGDRLFGDLGPDVRPIELDGAGSAYVSADGQRIGLHADDLDVVVAGSLPPERPRGDRGRARRDGRSRAVGLGRGRHGEPDRGRRRAAGASAPRRVGRLRATRAAGHRRGRHRPDGDRDPRRAGRPARDAGAAAGDGPATAVERRRDRRGGPGDGRPVQPWRTASWPGSRRGSCARCGARR